MLTLWEQYICWGVFWGTYFLGAIFFPSDKAKTRPIAKITQTKVIHQLILNCIATTICVPVLMLIPQLIFWEYSILKLGLVALMAEVWFYYMHRLMHHRWFYRWHADHHAFIQPYALAGLYCSVVEMIWVIQLAMFLPYQIVGLSFGETLLSNVFVALSALKGHAGLYFYTNWPRWTPQWIISVAASLDHDIHHRTLKVNFGILYLLDRIHGTHRLQYKPPTD